MAFWSSETFKKDGQTRRIVTPFSADRIKHGAYELSLGEEVFVTSSKDGKKAKLLEGEQFVIPPGQFAMLLTEEAVEIPADAIGLISIKAGIKFRGLVNVSGFHVDPGYAGKLKFSVYNAGSQNIVLARNHPLFLLWLNTLDATTKDVYPHGDRNEEITATDVMNMQGEVASPGELKCEIDCLRHSIRNLKWAVSIVFAIFLALFSLLAGLTMNRLKLATGPAISSSGAEAKSPSENKNAKEVSANSALLGKDAGQDSGTRK